MNCTVDNRIAVKFDNVSYYYGKKQKRVDALHGVDLEIEKGQIFALIGPSGCGKTTLTHCCVGWRTPKTGRVTIFGEKPGTTTCGIPGVNVGYMPQELSLYPDFTIDETFTLFARLYGLSKKELITRSNELKELLQLPSGSRLVSSLSGGQQRRVSFSVSLLHRPKLIVADEPTVGLDPLLRRSIWEYLLCLTQDDSFTAMITTHHIEEAKFAHKVCFLRDGEVLLTGKPQFLMDTFQVPSLDDVFLELCLSHSNQNGIPQNCQKLAIDCNQNLKHNIEDIALKPLTVISNDEMNQSIESNSSVDHLKINERNQKSTKLGRIAAMSIKNIVRLKHNIPVIIFQLLTPTLCIILFCTCFGRDPHNVSIAVHNSDDQQLSKWFLQAIDNSTINQIKFYSFDLAMKSLKEGQVSAIIQIEPGFTKAVENRYYYKQNVDKKTFEKSKIKVFIDWTNQIIGTHIQKTIFDAVVSFGEKCSSFYGEKYSSQTIVDIQKPIYGERKQSLTEFMTPGNVVIFVFFSAAASTALVFVLERKEGTFQRCIVAGVNPHEFLIAHLFQQILILIIQTAIMLFFTFYVFDTRNNGSLVIVIALVFLQGVCGVSFGLLISAISQQESHSFILLMGSLLPNFLMSGFIWPLETMPPIIMYIGKWLLNATAIDALRFVMYRGWTISHFGVAIGFIVTIVWIITLQTIALLIFRRSKFN